MTPITQGNRQSPLTAPLLEVSGLKKSFAVPVLRGLDFSVRAGEVHALVGSNGAGKSTLARILAGMLPSDGGTVRFGGAEHAPRTRQEAKAGGVTLMLQELSVFPTLTVAENLFLDRLPARFGFVDHRRLRREAATALARVGLGALDPDTPAATLGVGRQQQVELAAALAGECRLLILDEPTAALTPPETERLFENIRRLCGAGVAILYISHRMDELRRIADRVSVLRDGQLVGTMAMAQTTTEELVRLMAGHEMACAPTAAGSRGAVALRVRGLRREPAVREVTFDVHRGEILGLFGLVGAGRTETLRAIFGADAGAAGTVEIGDPLRPARIRRPAEAIAAGLALVPEDRKKDGLLLPRSITENTTLAALSRHARLGWLRPAAEALSTARIRHRLGVHCTSPTQPVATLSGGNQQKIVLGRWLLRDSTVLLLDEPTRGVDAAAKDAIHALLRELAAEGKAIVVVSSEVPELLSLCHRLIVLSAGRTVAEFSPADWTLEKLTAAAFCGHLETLTPC